MSEDGSLNLRFELRAYEATNACRLAALLRELTPGEGAAVTRSDVAALWAVRHPHHAAQTGRRRIAARISNALTFLKVAQIVKVQDDGGIVVINAERLSMSARNLAIVEDEAGVAIKPGLWVQRPEAPPHLLSIQEALEQAWLASVEAEEAAQAE